MKGLLLLSHDVEDVEALATRALLIRAGFAIDTASLESTLAIKTAFGLTVQADCFYDSAAVNTYDLLIIPGGKYVANTIDTSPIPTIAKTFDQAHKVIAAICAGPRFLGRAGLLDSKKYTAFPGSEIDAPKGVYINQSSTVFDGRILTAKGAGTVYQFVYQILKHFTSENEATQLLSSIHHP